MQGGSTSVEDVEELKKKDDLEQSLEEHRKVARESLQYYHDLKQKCSRQWKEIIELESTPCSPERNKKLQQLQNTFTLLLSADYHMSKLLPFLGA